MLAEIPFQIEGSTVFFEKAGAPPGRRRRIAGVVSTETRDRQQEIVVQKGLDFDPFLTHGWFNDNHSKATDGVVGYPERVQKYVRGQTLPNGAVAKSNCTWAEGYLLEGSKRADAIWALGQALAKSGGERSLGFSIEGTVQKRTGPGRRTVAKALVQNCAVTNMPVNPETKMEILAKSLTALPWMEDPVAKALGMGSAPDAQPAGPQSGAGAGQVLAPESLEGAPKRKRRLKKGEAIALLRRAFPAATEGQLSRIVDAAIKLDKRTKAA